ncbi:right-handed parallel beta-helix repeat-containing protein [bacterium]|nr:right-handed parallel beta-helix repeat-containing protein [bacterium]
MRYMVSILSLAVFFFLSSGPAFAANYPLEIVNIKPAGTGGMTANNRIFRAYPGIEYNIRAGVIGGLYPYTFSLSSAPSGMTINSSTGEISWASPQTAQSGATPTITVVDSEGTSVSSSWTITVTTSGFRFIDAVNGRSVANGGTGTLSNPWRSMRDWYEGNDYASKTRNSYVNEFLYFRAGTYYLDAYIEDSTSTLPGRMPVLSTYKPVVWMAYPGETPVIDMQYVSGQPTTGPHIVFYATSENVYIDGFRVKNMQYKGFELDPSGDYQTFRRLDMGPLGPTQTGGYNQSFILAGTGTASDYMIIQDSFFHNLDLGAGIKIYAKNKLLIEDNVLAHFKDTNTVTNIEGIALKGDVRRTTVRGNTIYDVPQKGIGGNMHDTTTREMEILYNCVYNASITAIDINQDGMAGVIHIYRNTFSGTVQVRNTDSSDGPFYFSNNVIVNRDSGTPAGSHIYHLSVSDPSRVVRSDNLVGYPADNILGSGCNLTSGYLSYIGTHGHLRSVPLNAPVPSAPASLTVN